MLVYRHGNDPIAVGGPAGAVVDSAIPANDDTASASSPPDPVGDSRPPGPSPPNRKERRSGWKTGGRCRSTRVSSFMAYRSLVEVLAGLVTHLDTPPSSDRHHPDSRIAPVSTGPPGFPVSFPWARYQVARLPPTAAHGAWRDRLRASYSARGDRLVAHPQCQAAAPAQTSFVRRLIRYLEPHFRDVVAPCVVVLVRHAGS